MNGHRRTMVPRCPECKGRKMIPAPLGWLHLVTGSNLRRIVRCFACAR